MGHPIYIAFSEPVRRSLASAKVNFSSELESALEGDASLRVVPAIDPFDPKSENRDVIFLVIAAGITASMVGSAVSRIIDSLSDKERVLMTEEELVVALDSKGEPIRDAEGNPVYNKKAKPAPFPRQGIERTSVSAGSVLKFDFWRS